MIIRRLSRAATGGGFALVLSLAVGPDVSPALAEGGGLNAEGCPNNRKTGDYHCHRGKSSGRSLSSRTYGLASTAR